MFESWRLHFCMFCHTHMTLTDSKVDNDSWFFDKMSDLLVLFFLSLHARSQYYDVRYNPNRCASDWTMSIICLVEVEP